MRIGRTFKQAVNFRIISVENPHETEKIDIYTIFIPELVNHQIKDIKQGYRNNCSFTGICEPIFRIIFDEQPHPNTDLHN